MSGPNAWGTVFDDYWDDFDATVMCRSLGNVWGEAIVNHTHGQGEDRIWLDNVATRRHCRNVTTAATASTTAGTLRTLAFSCHSKCMVTFECSRMEGPDVLLKSPR